MSNGSNDLMLFTDRVNSRFSSVLHKSMGKKVQITKNQCGALYSLKTRWCIPRGTRSACGRRVSLAGVIMRLFRNYWITEVNPASRVESWDSGQGRCTSQGNSGEKGISERRRTGGYKKSRTKDEEVERWFEVKQREIMWKGNKYR
jgi:hypothetical protein